MTAAVPMPCRRHVAFAKAAIALAVVFFSLSPLAEVGEPQDTGGRLIEALQMRRPEGSGPLPAIMLVPVCSGMSKKEHVAHYREMAERLSGMGYIVGACRLCSRASAH